MAGGCHWRQLRDEHSLKARMVDLLIELFVIAAFALPGTLFVASRRTMANLARLRVQYKEAFERGDVEECARLRPLLRAGLPDTPLSRQSQLVGDGETLLLEERWAEARDVLAKVDRSLLPEATQPGVLSNLAYATAQAGEPAHAITLIRKALVEATIQANYPPEKLPFVRGTLGVAQCLAGRHEEAVETLEPLVAEFENPKRARTTRAFYLATSYRALGRFAEAARAFALAAEGDGKFADRARDALATLNPHRG